MHHNFSTLNVALFPFHLKSKTISFTIPHYPHLDIEELIGRQESCEVVQLWILCRIYNRDLEKLIGRQVQQFHISDTSRIVQSSGIEQEMCGNTCKKNGIKNFEGKCVGL